MVGGGAGLLAVAGMGFVRARASGNAASACVLGVQVRSRMGGRRGWRGAGRGGGGGGCRGGGRGFGCGAAL